MRVKFLQSDLTVYENVAYYPFSSRILTSGNSIPVVTDHLLTAWSIYIQCFGDNIECHY